MATRIQQIKTLSDPDIQNQVASCLLFAAINVGNEDPGTPNHAARLAYANAILRNPSFEATTIAPYLLTNPTIAAAAGGPVGPSGTPFPDGDIDFVVASLFDRLASRFPV